MIDFSQSCEQEMILEWAADHGPGRWLDIGAADGQTASNTRALAISGWPGVAVEPAAALFDRLSYLYADRPDVETVQAAVTVDPDPLVRFYYSHDLLSTTEDDYRGKWADAGVEFVATYVATVTVEQLLTTFPGPYDLVSIDVEGGTLAIWDELRRLGAFAPGALVCVEAEDGVERREIQEACLTGWARRGVTPNNMLLEAAGWS